MSAAPAAATGVERDRRRARSATTGPGAAAGTRSPSGPRRWWRPCGRYLDQLAVSSRPVDGRRGVDWRCATSPRTSPRPIRRARRWRRSSVATSRPTSWPGGRPGQRPATSCQPTTIRHNLGMAAHVLRADHRLGLPRRPPPGSRSSPGTSPRRDEPTPKFLDDPTAAKFMAALATDPNRRRRLIVELLARTGMRSGELGGAPRRRHVRIGDTYWLRIPRRASSTTTATCRCTRCSSS